MIHPSGLPGKPSRLLQDGSRMPYTPPPPPPCSHTTKGHTVGGGSSPGGAYARAYLPQRPNDVDALGSGYTSLALSWGGGVCFTPQWGPGAPRVECSQRPEFGWWVSQALFFVSIHTST